MLAPPQMFLEMDGLIYQSCNPGTAQDILLKVFALQCSTSVFNNTGNLDCLPLYLICRLALFLFLPVVGGEAQAIQLCYRPICFCFSSETRSHYIPQDKLEFIDSPALPPKCSGYRCGPHHTQHLISFHFVPPPTIPSNQ